MPDSVPAKDLLADRLRCLAPFESLAENADPAWLGALRRAEKVVMMNGSLTMDDGRPVTVWGFTDPVGDGMGGMGGGMGNQPFPSPAMRLTEGQIAHTRLTVDMMMMHTIHHHGIEPSWQNDGVGHISWDVQGTYIYQWRPGHAGTYFYHCHTNTVLHAEMGMYGALIVDPPADSDGRVRAFRGGPHCDLETVWAFDEFDSRWHGLDWAAGSCGGDVGLNDLNPDYFIVTGVDGAQSGLTAPGVAVQQVGARDGAFFLVAGINVSGVRSRRGCRERGTHRIDEAGTPAAAAVHAVRSTQYAVAAPAVQPGPRPWRLSTWRPALPSRS